MKKYRVYVCKEDGCIKLYKRKAPELGIITDIRVDAGSLQTCKVENSYRREKIDD